MWEKTSIWFVHFITHFKPVTFNFSKRYFRSFFHLAIKVRFKGQLKKLNCDVSLEWSIEHLRCFLKKLFFGNYTKIKKEITAKPRLQSYSWIFYIMAVPSTVKPNVVNGPTGGSTTVVGYNSS